MYFLLLHRFQLTFTCPEVNSSKLFALIALKSALVSKKYVNMVPMLNSTKRCGILALEYAFFNSIDEDETG